MGIEAQANIIVVCGASGSGKSEFVKRAIAKVKRVSVFDTDSEYCDLSGFVRVNTIHDLVRYFKRARSGRFAFVPAKPGNSVLFDMWAGATFAWGNCAAVAEELADVTSPGKAPDAWGMLVRRGRKRNISIYGITQRPAESDKTIIGNASLIHCGFLARAQDRVYMSKELDICEYELSQLKPLDWIERDRNSRELRKGRILFDQQKVLSL